MKKRKVCAVLSTSALAAVFSTALSSSVLAAPTKILVEANDGKMCQYDMMQLIQSYNNKMAHEGSTAIYDDYENNAKAPKAYYDDVVKDYVDFTKIVSAYNDDQDGFDLQKFTEAAKDEDLFKDVPAGVTEKDLDENGKIIDKPVTPIEEGLKVESVSAITETTVTVKLAEVPAEAPTVKDFTVSGNTVAKVEKGASDDVYTLTLGTSLAGKKGTLTVNGINKDYNFYAVPVERAAVESVTFDNYRQFVVTFNTVVDTKTAMDAKNYYFEIVEGNAGSKLGARATLQNALNLAELGNATISAKNVDGKTVVTINLSEAARFTNSKDDANGIDVKLADGTIKALAKDTVVNVAVRNVKDKDEVRTIDTKVVPMKILDEKAPTFVKASTVTTNAAIGIDVKETDFKLEDGASLIVDGRDKVVFTFDEPVFGAEGLKTGTQDRDVKVYINGKLVAATSGTENDVADAKKGLVDGKVLKLDKVLVFNSSLDKTYEAAAKATLNVKAAVEAAVGTNVGYKSGEVYNVKVLGVTDLAGNIQVPSQIVFNTTVKDAPIPEIPPVVNPGKPAIKGIRQVADNIFQVETNMAGVTGELTIENADGEGGVVTEKMPLSTVAPKATPDEADKFYSYVVVDAVDAEELAKQTTKDDGILAYDGQDYINRVIKVSKVQSVGADKKTAAFGENYNAGTVKIQKDINAPVVVHPTEKMKYEDLVKRTITLDVKDVVPEGTEGLYKNPVDALVYAYANGIFSTNKEDIKAAQGADADYLPMKVSYVDANGATHVALVSNKDVKDGDKTIKGYAGAIKFLNGQLVVDLTNYVDLLSVNKDDALKNSLMPNANYKVELPKGYFADSKLDKTNDGDEHAKFVLATKASEDKVTVLGANIGDTVTITTGDQKYDVLYVSDARQANNGYTSVSDTIAIVTEEKPAVETPEETVNDGVPQTSKKLVKYNAPKNEISVQFTGSIDVDTLRNPENYTLNGKTLKEWGMTSSDITYVVDNKGTEDKNDDEQFAVFKVPTDSVPADGDVEFIVANVANAKGAKMTTVRTQVGLLDNTRPVAMNVKVAGQRQIKMVFDEPITYKAGSDKIQAAKNFEVMCGTTKLTVLDATIDVTDGKQLTLNLGSDIPASGDLTVKVIKDQNNDIVVQDVSANHNPLNSDKLYNAIR